MLLSSDSFYCNLKALNISVLLHLGFFVEVFPLGDRVVNIVGGEFTVSILCFLNHQSREKTS